MTREMHLICENAQEITLQAYPQPLKRTKYQ